MNSYLDGVFSTVELDEWFVSVHQKFYDDGKTRKECFDYLESLPKFNIMKIGIPAFDWIDMIWAGIDVEKETLKMLRDMCESQVKTEFYS